MDEIRRLAKQNLRDFLMHCELGDLKDEPIEQMITDISTLVHRERAKLGKDGPPRPLPLGRGKRAPPEGDERCVKRKKRTPASVRIMDSILKECAKLNSGRQAVEDQKRFIINQQNDSIRNHAKQIADADYGNAMTHLTEDRAILVCKDIQVRYNESVYWDVIQGLAKTLPPDQVDPLKGPWDGFTAEEKTATRVFSLAVHRGKSSTSLQGYRRLWKTLAELRVAGVDKILFYRTPAFDAFLDKHYGRAKVPLIETVLSWEKKYSCHIEALEDRAMNQNGDSDAAKMWLKQPCVAERVEIAEEFWNNAANDWFSEGEWAEYQSRTGAPTKLDKAVREDNFIFINLSPQDESFVRVSPIIGLREGDYLGIFSGELRYSDHIDETHGIRGPEQNLWLDYSRVTGVLNQMKVSSRVEDANVHLQWNLIKGPVGRVWRVEVRALKAIQPFDNIVRAASSEAQYRMHQESASAKRGFTREVSAENNAELQGSADCINVASPHAAVNT